MVNVHLVTAFPKFRRREAQQALARQRAVLRQESTTWGCGWPHLGKRLWSRPSFLMLFANRIENVNPIRPSKIYEAGAVGWWWFRFCDCYDTWKECALNKVCYWNWNDRYWGNVDHQRRISYLDTVMCGYNYL